MEADDESDPQDGKIVRTKKGSKAQSKEKDYSYISAVPHGKKKKYGSSKKHAEIDDAKRSEAQEPEGELSEAGP